MKKIAAILIAIAMLLFQNMAHASGREVIAKVTYFKCVVNEPGEGKKPTKVTVRFVIQKFNPFEDKGTLLNYPGTKEEDSAPILVTPKETTFWIMSNLNSQGGDLRITNGDIMLFGDGDGYQFTDLVLWDDNDPTLAHTEGYVRDYGSTYGDSETFKQFIKCQKSENKKL